MSLAKFITAGNFRRCACRGSVTTQGRCGGGDTAPWGFLPWPGYKCLASSSRRLRRTLDTIYCFILSRVRLVRDI
jgi:hypothetical protein